MARWLELRASNPALDSPYFHPEFATAVAATRRGVRVILGEDAYGVITSFLPVQVDKRTCRPAGAPAADFQGPICAPGSRLRYHGSVAGCQNLIVRVRPHARRDSDARAVDTRAAAVALLGRVGRDGRLPVSRLPKWQGQSGGGAAADSKGRARPRTRSLRRRVGRRRRCWTPSSP